MVSHISPSYTHEKLSSMCIDDFIDIFEDRTRHWLFEAANHMLKFEHGYYSAILLLLTYFEGIAIYLEGENSRDKSKFFFQKGFVSVFKKTKLPIDLLEKVGNTLYSEGRCGFFHDGMFRNKILISFMKTQALIVTLPKFEGQLDLGGQIESIIINPSCFLESVQIHFEDYVNSLRDIKNSNLRSNFMRACEIMWKPFEAGPIVGFDEPM